MKKIVVIGGESTGKSTLCEKLAAHYNTVWVPEYSRGFLQQKNEPYTYNDLLQIAKGQIETEKIGSLKAKEVLFIDTDLQVIKVWSEHKYNKVHTWILDNIATNRYDGYILTAPDIAWEYDPLREHASQQERNYFFAVYKDIVLNANIPFCICKGTEIERMAIVTEFIQRN